eukprot:gene10573-12509_t
MSDKSWDTMVAGPLHLASSILANSLTRVLVAAIRRAPYNRDTGLSEVQALLDQGASPHRAVMELPQMGDYDGFFPATLDWHFLLPPAMLELLVAAGWRGEQIDELLEKLTRTKENAMAKNRDKWESPCSTFRPHTPADLNAELVKRLQNARAAAVARVAAGAQEVVPRGSRSEALPSADTVVERLANDEPDCAGIEVAGIDLGYLDLHAPWATEAQPVAGAELKLTFHAEERKETRKLADGTGRKKVMRVKHWWWALSHQGAGGILGAECVGPYTRRGAVLTLVSALKAGHVTLRCFAHGPAAPGIVRIQVLYWTSGALHTEQHPPRPARGGILAEQMGLGKTVEIIALVLAHPRPPGAASPAAPASGTAKRARRPGRATKQLRGEELAPARSQATLVLAPPALLQQWAAEEAAGAASLAEQLQAADVVVCSHEALRRCPRDPTAAAHHPLQAVDWWRLCVDEAHLLVRKDWDDVASLTAQRRWAITGTPLSKGLRELQPMLTFCGLQLGEKPWFSQCVLEPAESGGEAGLGLARGQLLRVLCRHTSGQTIDGEALLMLPPKFEAVTLLTPSPDERRAADALDAWIAPRVCRGLSDRKAQGRLKAAVLKLRQLLAGYTLVPTLPLPTNTLRCMI